MSPPPLTFDSLKSRFPWRAIPDCPGRFVLPSSGRDLSPEELLGQPAAVVELSSSETPDKVLLVVFEGGGLLSFRKANGVHVHTLNTSAGLERRLRRLGIEPLV